MNLYRFPAIIFFLLLWILHLFFFVGKSTMHPHRSAFPDLFSITTTFENFQKCVVPYTNTNAWQPTSTRPTQTFKWKVLTFSRKPEPEMMHTAYQFWMSDRWETDTKLLIHRSKMFSVLILDVRQARKAQFAQTGCGKGHQNCNSWIFFLHSYLKNCPKPCLEI